MTRILFVHNHLSRFVEIDRDLLAEDYCVTERCEKSIKRLRPWKVHKLIASHDMVFGWFASWHTVFPMLLARRMGKPSVLVTGGYDTANLPEINYGSQRGGLRRLVSRATIHSASRLITNSEFARSEAIVNAGADPARITVIYHGVEPFPMGRIEREPIALTVGNVWRENFLRKGLLPFVQAARHLPEVRFQLVGRWCDDGINDLQRAAALNVEFLGFLSGQELSRIYGRASVYVQPSLHEAFGMSVAEAMTAGCVPVVTRQAALPEVVGDSGIYTDSTDSVDLASSIKQALAAAESLRLKARNRVLEKFSLDLRRSALKRLIGSLTAREVQTAGTQEVNGSSETTQPVSNVAV
jgi:glycosyltransferase involved in cell wall biosynthesis